MEEFKLNYSALRGPVELDMTYLPIGHVSRPSAFSRISFSESQPNDAESFKFEISLKEVHDSDPERSEEGKNRGEQFSTISSQEEESPKLKATPSFNPENFDVFKPKETKEEIIAEFMSSLKAPSAKPRQEKLATRSASGFHQYSVGMDGCETSYRNYLLEIGTDPSDIDFSPAQTSKFSHLSRPKVGFYSPEIRRAKIQKYRRKIQRWLKGEHKNKDLYCKRRVIAKNKKRVGGKFVKQDL